MFSQGPERGFESGLPTGMGTRMERAFDSDFSSVRVHEGGQARAIGAEAFTSGQEIQMPGARGGGELLGHELAHVVQQQQGRVQPTASPAVMQALGHIAE
jgi:hypothetical protein